MNQSTAEAPKGINGQLKILKHTIKYLTKQSNPADILNNQTSYEAFYYMQKILQDENFYRLNKKWKLFANRKKYPLDKIIIDIWAHLSDVFDEIIFPVDHQNEKPDDALKTTTQNERRVNVFDFIITITHSITVNQFLNETLTIFNQKLFNSNILQPIISILNKESLKLCLADKSNAYLFDLLVGILAILLDISENSLNDRKVWLELNAESILNKIKGWTNDFSFIIDEISMNINKKSLEETIEFLKLQPVDDQFVQNEQIYVDFLFMFKLVNQQNTFKEYKTFINHDCRSVFLIILKYFYENRSNLVFSFKIKYDYPNRQASLDERKLSIFNYVNLIINNLAFGSIEVAVYFNHREILSILVSFLNDADFMNKAMVSNPAIVSNIVNNLTLMSKYSDGNRIDWIELSIKEVIKSLIISRYMNIVWYKNINEKIMASALKCLSNLLHGHEIARVAEFDSYVKNLIEYLNDFGKMLSENKGRIVRFEIEHMTDDNEIVLIKTAWHEKVAVIGKLAELKRFASSLKFKKLIYSKCSQTIKLIIYYGNNVEKQLALKLMSQICLGYLSVVKDLNSDDSFIDFLLKLNDKQSSMELKRTTDILLWLLDKLPLNEDDEMTVTQDPSIMISYNFTQQRTALKLKDDLNKLGYNRIWLNMNELNGSNLSASLKAIESSRVVLVCVCEKYLFSEHNQIEARYVHKLNKPIVGLIIQSGSEQIKCWLEDILSKDSMNLSFFKSNWCESMIKLDSILNESLNISKTINELSNKHKTEINNEIEKWTKEKVTNWFNESELNPILIKNYSNFDGNLLKQLYMIRIDTPEFFIQSIFNECNNYQNDLSKHIKLSDILYFMDKLEKLFKKV